MTGLALCGCGKARIWRRGGAGYREIMRAGMSGKSLGDQKAMRRLARVLRVVALRDEILHSKGGSAA